MKKCSSLIVLVIVGLSILCTQTIQQRWQKMHDSKSDALEQFNEAKFGMFIHWGVYSLPAGIWNGRKIPGLGEWVFYHAQIPRGEYKQLCRQFNPVHFDAEAWVKLAQTAGMRYIVAMPKHHDGFAMYDSKVTDYDMIDATPFGRDPIKELYEACRKHGIRLGIYYSHATDWMDGGDAGVSTWLAANPDDTSKWAHWPANTWDPSTNSFETYIKSKAKPQLRELLNNMPGLMEIWYDVPRHMSKQQSFEFYKLAYDIQPNCLINSRVGNNFGDYWVPGDNKIPGKGEGQDIYWETPGTLNNTWGYKSYDVDWKSTGELIYWIVEIASKGGNYLLNIGPKADGTVPQESINQLTKIGEWMSVNGEAIYGTKSWTVTHEGPTNLEMKSTNHREKEGFHADFSAKDFWFTRKDNAIFAIALKWPEEGKITIRSLSNSDTAVPKIGSVCLLGRDAELEWEQTTQGLSVILPGEPVSEYGYVLAVKMMTKL
ncbi:alpha-L-fucosidase [candidate division KSB1 bacterium]|nr:alpha-L-fucosidase [candidate division KSB1 bacterium]